MHDVHVHVCTDYTNVIMYFWVQHQHIAEEVPSELVWNVTENLGARWQLSLEL